MRDEVDGGVVHNVVGGNKELGLLQGSAARLRARGRSLHHFLLLFVCGFRVRFESDTNLLCILSMPSSKAMSLYTPRSPSLNLKSSLVLFTNVVVHVIVMHEKWMRF